MSEISGKVVYSKFEERCNVFTHLSGTIFAALGFAFLLANAYSSNQTAIGLMSIFVYGICLIIMMGMSTLYHYMPSESKIKAIFRRFDHCSIALLIAGTYAPYMIIGLASIIGTVIEIIELSLALVIVVFNAINVHKFRVFTLIAYVVMGWLCIFAVVQLYNSLGMFSLIMMFLGGIFYSGGIIFYKMKRIPLNHAIWHVFVLLGAIFMWISIYFLVAKTA